LYNNAPSFELQDDSSGPGFQCVPKTCEKLVPPSGLGRFDADGDGVSDYYKMLDPLQNEYYIYWLSRKSPYLAYDTLKRRGQTGWTNADAGTAGAGGMASSMASDTCVMQD
jgi:hypothetical protein